MFAVIKTGGKQYKVAKDDIIRVEKLDGAEGASVELRDVLMLGEGGKVTVGTPMVDGAMVQAQVVEQTRGDKIIVFKKKRRKDYRRTRGHRQELTVLKVTGISPDGKKAAAEPKAEAKPKDKAEAPAKTTEPAKARDAAEAAPKTPAQKKAPAKKPAAKKTATKASGDKKPAAKKAPAKKTAAKKGSSSKSGSKK